MLAIVELRARSLLALVAVFSLSGLLPAQVSFEIRGERGDRDSTIVGLNQIFKPSVYLINPADVPRIQGFQMAITHDQEFLSVRKIDITWEGTDLDTVDLLNGQGPDFFLVQEVLDGIVTTGITLGVIFEQQDPVFSLGAGEWKVATLSYQAIQSTPQGTPTRLDFPAELGDPPVGNKYSVLGTGETQDAETSGLDVFVGGELNFTIAFDTQRVVVDPDEEITVPVYLQNVPFEVDGFSLGVKHDGTKLELVDAVLGEGVTSILPDGSPDGDFFILDKQPANGTGFTVAIIFSADDSDVVLDPLEGPHRVLDITYRVKATEGSSMVEITDELGDPPVAVLMDLFGIPQGQLPPATNPPPTELQVQVREGHQPFIRSDVDQSGSLTLSDAIGVIRYVTGQSLSPGQEETRQFCLAAFNVDGSTSGGRETKPDIDLTDAIYLLTYLFLDGSQPAAPFKNFGKECEAFDGEAENDMLCSQFDCP